MTVPACRPCRFFTYHPCYVANVFRMDPACAKRISLFPDIGPKCLSYEREPGADDE